MYHCGRGMYYHLLALLPNAGCWCSMSYTLVASNVFHIVVTVICRYSILYIHILTLFLSISSLFPMQKSI